MSQSCIVDDLLPMLLVPNKNEVKFAGETQEKALLLLERCFRLRSEPSYGFLINKADIISALRIETICTHDTADKFFRQHYTSKGVIR